MSNPSIDLSFVKQFEKEVHEAYQRTGAKLRPCVRTKSSVKGASTVFQKVGKGSASTKARHGKVPVMNIDHAPIECFLSDYYAGEWVDALDELKTENEERAVVANAGAHALGRKTDELILTQMNSSTNITPTTSGGLTKQKVLEAFSILGTNDVPDDGERYAVVGWKQWSDLLMIQEFANADYVGSDDLPWRGTQAKRWLGTLWMPHSGLAVDGNGHRLCHWWHKTALALAVGSEVNTDIAYHNDRAAWFVSCSLSLGAVLIDGAGLVTVPCSEA